MRFFFQHKKLGQLCGSDINQRQTFLTEHFMIEPTYIVLSITDTFHLQLHILWSRISTKYQPIQGQLDVFDAVIRLCKAVITDIFAARSN